MSIILDITNSNAMTFMVNFDEIDAIMDNLNGEHLRARQVEKIETALREVESFRDAFVYSNQTMNGLKIPIASFFILSDQILEHNLAVVRLARVQKQILLHEIGAMEDLEDGDVMNHWNQLMAQSALAKEMLADRTNIILRYLDHLIEAFQVNQLGLPPQPLPSVHPPHDH